MPLIFYESQLLFADGALAMDVACCCGDWVYNCCVSTYINSSSVPQSDMEDALLFPPNITAGHCGECKLFYHGHAHCDQSSPVYHTHFYQWTCCTCQCVLDLGSLDCLGGGLGDPAIAIDEWMKDTVSELNGGAAGGAWTEGETKLCPADAACPGYDNAPWLSQRECMVDVPCSPKTIEDLFEDESSDPNNLDCETHCDELTV